MSLLCSTTPSPSYKRRSERPSTCRARRLILRSYPTQDPVPALRALGLAHIELVQVSQHRVKITEILLRNAQTQAGDLQDLRVASLASSSS